MGGSTTTTDSDNNQVREPWAPSVPHLQNIMEAGEAYYGQGVGSNVWGGPTVAPLNSQLNSALQGMWSTATNNVGDTRQPYNAALSNIQTGGITRDMAPGIDLYQDMTAGQYGTNSQYRDIGNSAAQPGALQSNTTTPSVFTNFAQQGPTSTNYGNLYNAAGQPTAAQQNTASPNLFNQFATGRMGTDTNYDNIYDLAGQQTAAQANLTGVAGAPRQTASAGLGGVGTGPLASSQLGGLVGQGSTSASQLGDLARGNINVASNALGQFATNPGQTQSASNLMGQAQGNIGLASENLSGLAERPDRTMSDLQLGDIARGDNPLAAEQFLTQMAEGGQTVNPFLNAMLDTNAQRIRDQVASSMSGSGRYGSGSHTALLGRSIQEAANPLLAQAYEGDRNRMLSASGQIDAARQAARGQQMQAAGQIDQSNQAARGQQMQAAGLLDQARAGARGEQRAAAGQIDQANNALRQLQMGALGQIDTANAAARDQQMRATGQIDQSALGFGNLGIGAAGQMDQAQRAQDATRIGAAGQMDSAAATALGQQMQATGQLDAASNAQIQNLMGAEQGYLGVRQQNLANQLSGAQGLMQQAGQVDAASQAARAQQLAAEQGRLGQTQQDRANQLAGAQGLMQNAQAMDAQRNAANQIRLAAEAGWLGQNQQNINNQMQGAAGLLSNVQAANQRALGYSALAPQLYQHQFDPYQRAAMVGDFLQGRDQQALQGARQQFEAEEAMPWTQLARYGASLGYISPFAANSGQITGNQTSTTERPYGFMDYANLFQGGTSSPAFGAASGIASLLPFLSDRNEKKDIKRLGTSETTGLPLYSYRYKGDKASSPKVVGPMAQDIAREYPDAIAEIGGKMVVKPEYAGLLGAL